MKPVVYVASPYTGRGDKEAAVRVQIDAGESLMRYGLVPILPLLSHYWHQVYPHSWEEWMDHCLTLVAKSDVLLRVGGHSVGADLEVGRARDLSIPVYYDETELLHFWGFGRKENP